MREGKKNRQGEGGGRPSKFTQEFINVVEKVLNENINSIILTDEELFELINMNLEKEKQICYTTFKNYKSSAIKEENELYVKFLSAYKKAITIQKKSLFESLKNDTQAWQRYAWIIERKFSDWNLKNISEVNTRVKLQTSKEEESLLNDLM